MKAAASKRRVLVVRKTARSNEASTFKLFKDILAQFKLYDYCKINKSTQLITFPNKSEILFAGLDDVEKLKSITGITDIFIEEATEITLDDFLQLNLRLRAREPNLQIFICFNPVSKSNWVYKMWFADDANYDAAATNVLKTTYKDNRFLPPEYIKAIEDYKNTNYTYYKVYALGEFAALDKLVFTNWEIKPFNHEEIDGELMCGLDWGYTHDPTAFVSALMVESEKTIYVYNSWSEKGMTNDKIAQKIIDTSYGKSLIIADAAEPKSIQEVKEKGIKMRAAKKGKGSILGGIQQLQAYRIYIHPSCTDVIEEFQNYTWKKDKKTGEYINEPIDEYNHSIDALRYSLQCVKGKLRTLDKNAL